MSKIPTNALDSAEFLSTPIRPSTFQSEDLGFDPRMWEPFTVAFVSTSEAHVDGK